MNEYTPIDINDRYTGLPIGNSDNVKKSKATVFLYNDAVPNVHVDKIQTLDALVDTIDSRTAIFGDMLNPANPYASMGLINKRNSYKDIVVPNSLNDDITTRFFVGSLTIIILYILYRMMNIYQ